MNERIRLLAEQATELDYTTFDSYNHKTVEHYKFNCEKFAELIVKECAEFVKQRSDFQSDLGIKTMLKITGQQVKEHFGVEE